MPRAYRDDRTTEERRASSLRGAEKAKVTRPRLSHRPNDGCPHQRAFGAAADGDVGYSDAEAEFLRACEAYRSDRAQRFMVATDYLAVLISLGYRKG